MAKLKIANEDHRPKTRPIGKTWMKILRDKGRAGYRSSPFGAEAKAERRAERIASRVALRRELAPAREEVMEGLADSPSKAKRHIRAAHCSSTGYHRFRLCGPGMVVTDGLLVCS